MAKNLASIPPTPEKIQQWILLIRGEKVLLDTHLAVLYGVQTKVLLQAVKSFSTGFYVPINPRGISELEVTICDLNLGWSPLLALCIY
jgi:hypothetical protein